MSPLSGFKVKSKDNFKFSRSAQCFKDCSKLANKIKILALLLFTIIIALLSFLLINGKKQKEWFEGYGKGEESKFVKDYQKGKR